MTSPPERHRAGFRSLLAGTALAVLALPAAADSGGVDRALGAARRALTAGDGVAAEASLREARAAGAEDDLVRALMGEALLAQDDLPRARRWLAAASFDASSRALGFRMLGRLEMREGRLPDAGRAFDRALAVDSNDPLLWADIARLRYAGGEQAQAVTAVERAVELDPANPGALAFRGLLMRQQVGHAAALPWLDAAEARAPDDVGILADKAATLAELGRTGDALQLLRKVHKIEPGNPLLNYQQAVIAARGGKRALARTILQRSKAALRDRPGAILLAAALELDSGNVNLAVEVADRLLRYQPDNRFAQVILARAISRTGDPGTVAERFASLAMADGASPYLQTLVARAMEETGQRDRAVPLLMRAASPRPPVKALLPPGAEMPVLAARYPDAPTAARDAVPFMRASVAQGNTSAAAAAAERLFAANPGAPAAAEMVGDVAAAQGRAARALSAYQAAARIEFGESEFLRIEPTLRALGRARDADLLIVAFASEHPQSLAGVRLLANLRARSGQWAESARLLGWLDWRAGGRDPAVIADRAFAELRNGNRETAKQLADRAAKLQPASPSVRQIVRLTR